MSGLIQLIENITTNARSLLRGTNGAANVQVVNDSGSPLPVTIAGGSSITVNGAGLADVILTDNAGILFVGRDNGTTISFIKISDSTAYTPIAPIKVAGVQGVASDSNLTSLFGTNHADLAAILAKIVSGAATDSNLTSVTGALHTDLVQLHTDNAAQLPATLGVKTAAASLSIAHASDDAVAVGVGAPADSAASSDGGTFSLLALTKRLLGKLPTLGRQTMANSMSVVVASDQAAVPTTLPNTNVRISTSPTLTGNYTAGQLVGSIVTLSNAARVANGTGIIQSVTMNFSSVITTPFDIVFFNSLPAGTYTDKATAAIAMTDLANVIGVAHVTDPTQFSASTTMQAQGLAIPFASAGGGTSRDLYALIIARASITLASGDAAMSVRILQD